MHIYYQESDLKEDSVDKPLEELGVNDLTAHKFAVLYAADFAAIVKGNQGIVIKNRYGESGSIITICE